MIKNYIFLGFLSAFMVFSGISVSAQTIIHSQDFDTNATGWSAGTRQTTVKIAGTHSLQLDKKDDTDSGPYDLTPYTRVVITFTYRTALMEANDKVEVFFNDHGGPPWPGSPTLQYTFPAFANGTNYTVSATFLSSVSDFTGADEIFRIKNNSNNADDRLYIDNITIVGYEDCWTDITCAPAGTTTWNGAAWSSGAPTTSKPAVINGNYNTTTHGDFTCCNLTINNTYTLTIASGDLVEVQSNITNNGAIVIENSGNLVQYYDSATNSGTGTLTVTRNSNNMLKYDYTYWASPVTGFDIGNIDHSRAYYYGTDATSWVRQDTGAMIPGRGYIARTDNTNNVTPTITTVDFSGTLNNGTINYATDSATNSIELLGNPYPSAMDADKFILKNAGELNLIGGTIYLWTRTTRLSNWQVGAGTYSASNYSSYTMLGGAGGANPPFAGKIASGQGFFVETEPAAPAGNIVFNNCMRVINASDNAQFYKSASASKTSNQKHRFWLDIVNKSGESNQMLIGYVSDATIGFDKMYDAKVFENTPAMIYSYVNDDFNDKKLTIQGRPFPTTADEVIPIGIEMANGLDPLNRIELPEFFEGVFVDTDIFLVDKLLNVIHNLKTGPYEFILSPGEYKERFEIKFNNKELSSLTVDEIVQILGVSITKNEDNTLTVTSSNQKIKEISVFNILGQNVFSEHYKGVDDNIKIDSIASSSSILIFKTVLTNGDEVIKKVIF